MARSSSLSQRVVDELHYHRVEATAFDQVLSYAMRIIIGVLPVQQLCELKSGSVTVRDIECLIVI